MRFIKLVGIGILGFIVGAILTYLLIFTFSNNTHDKDLESAMTAFFVGGPIGFLIFIAIGFFKTK